MESETESTPSTPNPKSSHDKQCPMWIKHDASVEHEVRCLQIRFRNSATNYLARLEFPQFEVFRWILYSMESERHIVENSDP